MTDDLAQIIAELRAKEKAYRQLPVPIAKDVLLAFLDVVEAAQAYIDECDNPVPDGLYRKVLRDRVKVALSALAKTRQP